MELNPQLTGFILFCAQRRGKEWPALYDEMCRVAGRGLYQNLHHKDLSKLGLSFSLNHIEETLRIVEEVTETRFSCKSLDSQPQEPAEFSQVSDLPNAARPRIYQ